MDLRSQALFLCLVIFFISMSNGIPDQDPEAVQLWFKNLENAKEKITKLHFYWHESYIGKNPTTHRIGTSSSTSGSPFPFGYTGIFDVPLRSGPEPTSKLVGRAQGLGYVADQHELSFVTAATFEFIEGEFNGSTLSLLGRHPIDHMFTEMPILGGTAAFRLARGIATLSTYLANSTTGQVVIKYNVVVIHY